MAASFKKLYLKTKRGRLAIVAIVLGNVAAAFGSIQKINDLLFSLIGHKPLQFLYNNMVILVSLVFLVGYAIILHWLYQKIIMPRQGLKKALFAAITTLIIAGTCAANIYLLPSQPDPESVLRGERTRWANRIFIGQAENGGIRVHTLNPSTETQAWTTAQCLLAALNSQTDLETYIPSVRNAFEYIERARHPRDGILEDEGWGLFEPAEHTVTEIAGWIVLAYIASLESETRIWNESEIPQVLNRIERDINHIVGRQESTGGWRPIKEEAPASKPAFTRTYSTIIALWALAEARRSPTVFGRISNKYDNNLVKGISWLLSNYDQNLGWVPNPNRLFQKERFDGLTAQVLFVLSRAEKDFPFLETDKIYIGAEKDFVRTKDLGKRLQCNNHRIHDADQSFPPTTFVAEASTMLWFPWSFAELTHLSTDASLTDEERNAASQLRKEILNFNIDELAKFVETEYSYVLAENLLCLTKSINQR